MANTKSYRWIFVVLTILMLYLIFTVSHVTASKTTSSGRTQRTTQPTLTSPAHVLNVFSRLAAFIPLMVHSGKSVPLPGPGVTATPAASPSPDASGIYWGAYIAGDVYGITDVPPWDMRPVSIFESHTNKKISILHWGQRWYRFGKYDSFNAALMEAVRQHGAISLLDWTSRDYNLNPEKDQPIFSLGNIISGKHDGYIRQWAQDAKAWGKPFFLRFDHEMNGDWYPWSERTNGNQPGEFVQAWRHIHDIFSQVGATNVTWVWCPNIEYQGTIPLDELYPGDAYVDWTCMDGYNWGPEPNHGGRWQTFDEIFRTTYDHLMKIAPNKPIMIGETSSTEAGGSKAAWINEMLTQKLPYEYPHIKALVWFNVNADNMDWVIESSPEAEAAFRQGIQSSYYLENAFGGINQSPIPAPEGINP